jgi:hypothetical protein
VIGRLTRGQPRVRRPTYDWSQSRSLRKWSERSSAAVLPIKSPPQIRTQANGLRSAVVEAAGSSMSVVGDVHVAR